MGVDPRSLQSPLHLDDHAVEVPWAEGRLLGFVLGDLVHAKAAYVRAAVLASVGPGTLAPDLAAPSPGHEAFGRAVLGMSHAE